MSQNKSVKLIKHESMVDVPLQEHLGLTIEKNQKVYSDLVIQGRAIPFIFDGLKPVNRRILYAFKDAGDINKFIKSSKNIGHTMGSFHPHGDATIYGAVVNATQPFKNRFPITNGQGNWGNIEGDSEAAMRYTEVKLTSDMASLLFENMEKDGVISWGPNYDDKILEPLVLPVKYPIAFLNGTSGVAYGGITTEIPSYNIKELTNFYIYLLENEFWSKDWKVSEHKDKIMKVIPTVDLPTGCNIYFEDTEQEDTIFKGRFSFRMRANYEISEKYNTITFRNIPAGISASRIKEEAMLAGLSYKLDKAKNKIPKTDPTTILNISENIDILSYSTFGDDDFKNDAELVFTFKKGVNLNVELMKAFKLTSLDTSFPARLMFIDRYSCPKEYSLYEHSLEFLHFRKHVVYKSFQYDIKKLEENLHLLFGLRIIHEDMDGFIKLVRESEDENLYDAIKKQFKVDDIQIDYLLLIQLRKLSKTSITKLKEEIADKESKLDGFKEIISSEKNIFDYVKKDYEDLLTKTFIKGKRNVRISKITNSKRSMAREDFIEDKEIIVMYMEDDTIAFVDKNKFRLKNKGTRTTNNKINNDFELKLKLSESCKLKDTLLLMSNLGRMFKLKAFMLGDDFRFVGNILKLEKEEHIISLLKFDEEEESNNDKYYMIATKNGKIKGVNKDLFKNTSSNRSIKAITLEDKDTVCSFIPFDKTPNEKILLLTTLGRIIKYSTDEVSIYSGTAKGNRSATLAINEMIVESFIYNETNETSIIGVSDTGKAKKTLTHRITDKKRVNAPNLWFNNDDINGTLVSGEVIADEENEILMVLTEKADVSLIKTKGFNHVSRTAKGSINLIKLEEGEKINIVKKINISELTPVQTEILIDEIIVE